MITAVTCVLLGAAAVRGERHSQTLSDESRERKSMVEYGHEFGYSKGVVFVAPEDDTIVDDSRGACSHQWQGNGALMMWASKYRKGPKARRHQSSLKAYELLTQKMCRKGREIRMLEIGVQSGGSIQMWRWFFGTSRLRYVGIDTNPLSAAWADETVHIYVGSSQHRELLNKIVRHHGPFDLIVDDGGGKSSMMDSSFDGLYPEALAADGILCIENLNNVYRKETTAPNAWLDEDYKAEENENTFVGRSKSFVDALHARRQREPDEEEDREIFEEAWKKARHFSYRTEAIHFYESMVCLQRMPETEHLESLEAGDFRIPFMWHKGTAGNSELVTREGTRRTVAELRKRFRDPPDGSGLRPEHLPGALRLSPDPLERTQWTSNEHAMSQTTDSTPRGGGAGVGTRGNHHRHRPHHLAGSGDSLWRVRGGNVDGRTQRRRLRARGDRDYE